MNSNRLPEVRTEQYEFAHGRGPRGTGLWAFSTQPRPTAADQVVKTNGTYTQAKREARLLLRGHPCIWVQS